MLSQLTSGVPCTFRLLTAPPPASNQPPRRRCPAAWLQSCPEGTKCRGSNDGETPCKYRKHKKKEHKEEKPDECGDDCHKEEKPEDCKHNDCGGKKDTTTVVVVVSKCDCDCSHDDCKGKCSSCSDHGKKDGDEDDDWDKKCPNDEDWRCTSSNTYCEVGRQPGKLPCWLAWFMGGDLVAAACVSGCSGAPLLCSEPTTALPCLIPEHRRAAVTLPARWTMYVRTGRPVSSAAPALVGVGSIGLCAEMSSDALSSSAAATVHCRSACCPRHSACCLARRHCQLTIQHLFLLCCCRGRPGRALLQREERLHLPQPPRLLQRQAIGWRQLVALEPPGCCRNASARR